jgi:hypothetical protein
MIPLEFQWFEKMLRSISMLHLLKLALRNGGKDVCCSASP